MGCLGDAGQGSGSVVVTGAANGFAPTGPLRCALFTADGLGISLRFTRPAHILLADACLATAPGGINAVLATAVATHGDVWPISSVQSLRLVHRPKAHAVLGGADVVGCRERRASIRHRAKRGRPLWATAGEGLPGER